MKLSFFANSSNGDNMKYINEFFLYSIFGYIMETLLYLFLKVKKQSGFLYLWWTPFYGTGVLISFYIYKVFNKKIFNKVTRNILLFITYFLVFSVLEYCGGIILEMIYGYAFWNYSKIPLHLGKYISVPTSLGWAVFAFVYVFVIKKYTDKMIKYIPEWLTKFLVVTFILDVIFSLLKVVI